MKIECTVEELKELIKRETPVAGTTDAKLTDNQLKQVDTYLSESY